MEYICICYYFTMLTRHRQLKTGKGQKTLVLCSLCRGCLRLELGANSSAADTLQWRRGRYGVSTHQPHPCLLNRLFRRRSKKTSKLRVTGPCARNSPGTGEFPAQKAITRKMFPFDDVIMILIKFSRHIPASALALLVGLLSTSIVGFDLSIWIYL